MKQTPLFQSHLSRNARTEVYGDWMLAHSFAGAQAEVDAARAGAVIFDLAEVRTVTLAGAEVRRWANGMFTHNLKRVQPGDGRRNAMCDDRGRLQGLLDLYVVREDLFLGVLDGVGPTWFEERYRMFMVLDDIELEAFEGEPWVLSVQGPGARGVLEALRLPIPERALVQVPAASGPGFSVLRKDRTGLGGFDLLVPDAALLPTWEAALASGALPAGREAFEALRIKAGRVRWPEDGSDKSLVHELGLVAECVAFDKGCYVGQETINRVERMGQVQKRLTGLVLAQDALPPAGAEVVQGDAVVGTVTSAARVDGQAVALGVLRKTAWEPGTPVVVRAGDREVAATTSALPFP